MQDKQTEQDIYLVKIQIFISYGVSGYQKKLQKNGQFFSQFSFG